MGSSRLFASVAVNPSGANGLFFWQSETAIDASVGGRRQYLFRVHRQLGAFESNPRNGWVRVDHEAERMVLDPTNTTKAPTPSKHGAIKAVDAAKCQKNRRGTARRAQPLTRL
jgi:hypothetical protein